jgi:glyceraldehyde-3-phosphate dehydrogenase/erythrose-4-phosphate dehydrogenase
MSELQEVTFSDLLQRPNETVEKLKSARSRSLRVHRRGSEDDLILTTAARATQDDELIDVATRLLRAVMSNPVVRSTHLLEILPKVFPWIRFLTDGDRMTFAQELVDAMDASESLGSPTPVLQLITEWRHTAEIYADPELLAALGSDVVEDFGTVPPPVV